LTGVAYIPRAREDPAGSSPRRGGTGTLQDSRLVGRALQRLHVRGDAAFLDAELPGRC
jgi:hypothetical protein